MEMVEAGDMRGVCHDDLLVGVAVVQSKARGEGAECTDASEANGVVGYAEMCEAVYLHIVVLGIYNACGSSLGIGFCEGGLCEGVDMSVAVCEARE